MQLLLYNGREMTTTPESYILPDLISLLQYQTPISPHYEQAAAESSAWLSSFSGVIPAHKRRFFEQRGSELLCGYAYSYADHEGLRTAMDFVNLLYVYDDIGDDQNGQEASETGAVLLNALRDPDWDDGSQLAQMAHEVQARLRQVDAPPCYARFLKHCEDYISANIRQAELRERGEILELDEFIPLRREHSGVPFCIGVIGFVIGRDIPDEVFEHPVMTRLYLAAVDMVWLANDLYSYNREQAIGLSGDNILTILMKQESCDLQGAADHVGRRFAELMAGFEADKARLPSWGVDFAAFVKGLETWVVGNCQWSLETQRYFGVHVEEVKRTRVVKLDRKRDVGMEDGSIDG